MSNLRLGEMMALGTALCWTFSAMAFESASRRVGSLPVNWLRLVVALIGLTLVGVLGPRHLVIPTDAPRSAWNWLLISGVVGFFIGDLALFRAFVIMGARLSSLTQALAPPLAALATFLVIPERHMSAIAWLGMGVTVAGIVLVITERVIDNDSPGKIARQATPKGLILGVIGAAGQGIGLALTDRGMRTFDHAFAANQMRVIAGVTTFGLFILLRRDTTRVSRAVRDPFALLMLTIGALFGPIIGVSMLMRSMSLGVSPGVAQTFGSLVPILIIPFVVLRGKEHITWRAVVGAVVAVAGVGILLNAK